jgi:hypothetical protein
MGRGDPKLVNVAARGEEAVDIALGSAGVAKNAAQEAARDLRNVKQLIPDPHEQVVAELATMEGAALLRIGPRRNRWRDLQRFDEQWRRSNSRGPAHARDRRTPGRSPNEPERHAQELAGWFESGSQGERPLSDAAALDEQIADLQAEYAALGVSYGRLLAERAEHVRKHRKQMVSTVRKAKEAAARDYAALVDQLEEKRQELLDLWRPRRGPAFPRLTAARPLLDGFVEEYEFLMAA